MRGHGLPPVRRAGDADHCSAPDGQLLASSDGGGRVSLWDGRTSEEHAVDTASRIVGHGLSRSEWRAVFGDREHVDVCA